MQLGVVSEKTATRVIYFDAILYSVGGVVGTMHHLYLSGTPATHMAMGAFFSAMEVIPLTFLTVVATATRRHAVHRRRGAAGDLDRQGSAPAAAGAGADLPGRGVPGEPPVPGSAGRLGRPGGRCAVDYADLFLSLPVDLGVWLMMG